VYSPPDAGPRGKVQRGYGHSTVSSFFTCWLKGCSAWVLVDAAAGWGGRRGLPAGGGGYRAEVR
jgi:hypothetical protein